MNNTRTIEHSDIVSFTMAIQEAILDGYHLSEASDYAPQNIGFVYVTTMFKEETQNMPIGNLELTVSVDTEQAIKQLQEITNKVGEVDSNTAEQIVAQAVSVESTSVAPKQTQRRSTRK